MFEELKMFKSTAALNFLRRRVRINIEIHVPYSYMKGATLSSEDGNMKLESNCKGTCILQKQTHYAYRYIVCIHILQLMHEKARFLSSENAV